MNKFLTILISILSLAFILLLFEKCNKDNELSNIQNDHKLLAITYNAMKFEFEKELDSLGRETITQQQLITTQKSAIEAGILELEGLRKIKSQVKVETITKIDSVFIQFEDTLQNQDIINVPKNYAVSSIHFSLTGKILKHGLLVDTLLIPNTQTITIGDKQQEGLFGKFKKSESIVVIKNSNPYVNIQGVNNVIIEDNQKKVSKLTIFGVGVGVGSAITLYLLLK